jgi:amidase
VLEEFPRLERLLDRDGGALSGGEQQLLASPAASLSEPDLVLLDEPTEGIQPSIIDEIIDLLKAQPQRGISMVLVEQSLDFITGSRTGCPDPEGPDRGRDDRRPKAADPALIEEFVGFGGGPRRKPAPAAFAPPHAARPRAPPPRGRIAVARTGQATRRPPSAPTPRRIAYMTVQTPHPRPDQGRSSAASACTCRTSASGVPRRHAGHARGLRHGGRHADYLPPVDYPRTSGYRPTAEENPINAWYVKTEMRGAPRGPLAGKKVALKDNVCLAGVPMMNGASTLKGYTPDVDATVVTRLLDAGATIVGKAHCEYFCLSGGSHTNATGPVHNPHKHGYSAGGSSSGSARWWRGRGRHGDRRRPGRLDPHAASFCGSTA